MISELIKKNLQEREPELWNSLVYSELTEQVVKLAATAYETGVDVGKTGGENGEDIEVVVDRTCEAFASTYAAFCSHMIRTHGHEVPAHFNSIQGQLAAATQQAVPAFLRMLAVKLAEFGFKPLDPHSIQVAQEISKATPGGLILP